MSCERETGLCEPHSPGIRSITPVRRPHPKLCGTPGEATGSGVGEEEAGCTRLLLQVKPHWIGPIDGRESSFAFNARAKAPLFDGLAFLLF